MNNFPLFLLKKIFIYIILVMMQYICFEPGQDRKVAALRDCIYVHHFFWRKKFMEDELYMNIALQEAAKAYKKEEIPVGAVIVKNGKVISKAYNKKNKSNRVKDHAEIIAIDKANKKLRNWRLEDCEIYITLEPCPMCASAIEQARIRRIITGAVNKNVETSKLSQQILCNKDWKRKVESQKCSDLLNEFFKNKR